MDKPIARPTGKLSQGITSLGTLSPQAERALHLVGSRRKWANGKVLIARGQTSQTAILVLSGRLRVVTISPGGEEHLMRWLEPGEITGLSSVLADTPFPADLIAAGPTEVLHIDRQRLIDLIRTDGETALAIVRVLSLRVIQLVDIITEHALVSLEHKVWSALQRLATYHGIPVPGGIKLRVSQSDIARAVAASRQRVNIQLQRLQHRGLIRLEYRCITLFETGVAIKPGQR